MKKLDFNKSFGCVYVNQNVDIHYKHFSINAELILRFERTETGIDMEVSILDYFNIVINGKEITDREYIGQGIEAASILGIDVCEDVNRKLNALLEADEDRIQYVLNRTGIKI